MNLRSLFTVTICGALLALPVQAKDLFKEVDLEGPTGPHLVTNTTVNVRKTPDSTGTKIGQLDRRDRVDVLGRVKGTQWYAVRKGSKDLGFVYAPSLTPMIDASLSAPLSGKINLSESDKPDCTYEINFAGRAEEDEIVFISADYLAEFKCQQGFDVFTFNAMMFMSEVPVDLGNKPIYQITLNLPEIATGYEEFLSATALYNATKKQVTMDSVSLEILQAKDFKKSKPAKNVKQALHNALELQLNAFSKKAWKIIAGKLPSPGDKSPQ